MSREPLTASELSAALADLPDWRVVDGALTATYKTARENVPSLYAAVAAVEDAADHHARITILYGTITFALTTHDADDAITAKDVDTAARIDALAGRHEAIAQPE